MVDVPLLDISDGNSNSSEAYKMNGEIERWIEK